MRRTQIYLDESLWDRLHLQARIEETTVSEVIRRALKEKYDQMSKEEKIRAVRQAWGVWRDRQDIGDANEYIRKIRSHKSERTRTLWQE